MDKLGIEASGATVGEHTDVNVWIVCMGQHCQYQDRAYQGSLCIECTVEHAKRDRVKLEITRNFKTVLKLNIRRKQEKLADCQITYT